MGPIIRTSTKIRKKVMTCLLLNRPPYRSLAKSRPLSSLDFAKVFIRVWADMYGTGC